MNAYNKWREGVLAKESDVLPQLVTVLKDKEDMLEMDNSELNLVLSVFFLALRKENGDEYPANTIFGMATALQRRLQMQGRVVSFFQDNEFRGLKNCIDNLMQEKTKAGIGMKIKQAQPITKEQE